MILEITYKAGKTGKKKKISLSVEPGYSYKLLRQLISEETGRRSSGIHISNVSTSEE